MTENDFLFLRLRHLPYIRALVCAVEAGYYQGFNLPAPIHDVGCDDGYFAALIINSKIDVGLDPWTGPTHEAGRRGCYGLLPGGRGEIAVPG